MKNLLTVVMLFVFSTALYAQKDVTKFLGIPVDGTKTAMIQKLKAKGFTPSTWTKISWKASSMDLMSMYTS